MLDLEADSDNSIEIDVREEELIFKNVPRKLPKPAGPSVADKQALQMQDLKENSSVVEID